MKEALLNFQKQFLFDPVVENPDRFDAPVPFEHYIIGGMGGSHLAADIVASCLGGVQVHVHSDYGVPRNRLQALSMYLASSHSGNTEETLDFYESARREGRWLAAITAGGKLLEMAKQDTSAYIQLPDEGLQPRMALGHSLIATLRMLGEEELILDARRIAERTDFVEAERLADNISIHLLRKTPVIYSSRKNFPIAQNWKIRLNETGKTPAFCNVIPELNHNEMTGFDAPDKEQFANFYFLFINDPEDDPRIRERISNTKSLLRERGYPIGNLDIQGGTHLQRMVHAIHVADWTAYQIAIATDREPEAVPMVEEFKGLMRHV